MMTWLVGWGGKALAYLALGTAALAFILRITNKLVQAGRDEERAKASQIAMDRVQRAVRAGADADDSFLLPPGQRSGGHTMSGR